MCVLKHRTCYTYLSNWLLLYIKERMHITSLTLYSAHSKFNECQPPLMFISSNLTRTGASLFCVPLFFLSHSLPCSLILNSLQPTLVVSLLLLQMSNTIILKRLWMCGSFCQEQFGPNINMPSPCSVCVQLLSAKRELSKPPGTLSVPFLQLHMPLPCFLFSLEHLPPSNTVHSLHFEFISLSSPSLSIRSVRRFVPYTVACDEYSVEGEHGSEGSEKGVLALWLETHSWLLLSKHRHSKVKEIVCLIQLLFVSQKFESIKNRTSLWCIRNQYLGWKEKYHQNLRCFSITLWSNFVFFAKSLSHVDIIFQMFILSSAYKN